MASIQRIVSSLTKEISYRAQVRVKGHTAQGKLSRTRRRQWTNSIEAAIRENRYFPQAKASRTLFAEVVERYRANFVKALKESNRFTRKQRCAASA